MTTPQTLADHPGEHNARRAAMRNQAKRRGQYVEAMIATLIPVMGSDGKAHVGAISYPLDYPAKADVAAIHRDLTTAYAKQHNKARWFAEDATAWDAFLVYDARRVAVAA